MSTTITNISMSMSGSMNTNMSMCMSTKSDRMCTSVRLSDMNNISVRPSLIIFMCMSMTT